MVNRNNYILSFFLNLFLKIRMFYYDIFYKYRFIYLVFILPFLISLFIFFFLLNISNVINENNFLIYFFVISLLLIFVLLYLVGKQIVRLWEERRQKMVGSQLHFRLVILFVGLSAVPAIFVSKRLVF